MPSVGDFLIVILLVAHGACGATGWCDRGGGRRSLPRPAPSKMLTQGEELLVALPMAGSKTKVPHHVEILHRSILGTIQRYCDGGENGNSPPTAAALAQQRRLAFLQDTRGATRAQRTVFAACTPASLLLCNDQDAMP